MNALDFEVVETTNVEFTTLLPVTSGGGGEAPIEIVKQNGVVLPIVGKAVNIDAYTTHAVDVRVSELSQGIDANTSNINAVENDVNVIKGKIEQIEESVETNTENINTLTDKVDNSLEVLSDKIDTNTANIETNTANILTLSGRVDGIDARTTTAETNIITLFEKADESEQNINGLTEQLLDVKEDLQGVEERVGAIENGVKVENFAVRYNPKFDTLHRPQGDRAPLLLNRSTIEYIGGKRYFNIDIVYLNYVPSSAPSTGFEQNEILFLLPRVAGRNYSDYSSLLSADFEPYATKDAVYLLGQYYSVGMITRANAVNYNVTTANYCICQLTANGELINNTTGFFKSTSSTQNNVYQISGRYEIASDWTEEEYNDYIFTEASVMTLSVDE